MKATTDPRVTFAELQRWPDDGLRYERYDGEVIVVPSPFLRHQRVASNNEEILRRYEQATGGMVVHAPFDIVFDEHNVVQPDIVYFRAERRHLLRDWQETRAAPDLAVEVLSRSTRPATAVARCGSSRASACRSTGLSIRRRTRWSSTCCAAARTSWSARTAK